MTNGKNSLHPGDAEIYAELGEMVVMVGLKNLGGHVSVNFQLEPYIALAFATKLLEAAQEVFKEQKVEDAAKEKAKDKPALRTCVKCGTGSMVFMETISDGKLELYRCSNCEHTDTRDVA